MLAHVLFLQLGLLGLGATAVSLSEITENRPRPRYSQQRSLGGCDVLSSKLPDQVYWPGSEQYLNQSQGTES
jgi:hypothetical protein